MKIFNLIHGDKVWVYNLTKKVYNELITCRHNRNGLTTFNVTDNESKYPPVDAKLVPTIKLIEETLDGKIVYHIIHRHNLWDRLRSFKHSFTSVIIEEFM